MLPAKSTYLILLLVCLPVQPRPSESPDREIVSEGQTYQNATSLLENAQERVIRQLKANNFTIIPMPLPSPLGYRLRLLDPLSPSIEKQMAMTYKVDKLVRQVIKYDAEITRLLDSAVSGAGVFGAIMWLFLGLKAFIIPMLFLQGGITGPLHLFKRELRDPPVIDFEDTRWLSTLSASEGSL